MQHWLLMFRPETYELVRQHGQIGVHPTFRKRFQEVRTGDKFIAYISQQRTIEAIGKLTSNPFEDQSPIFGATGVYPHRCRVEFEQIDLAIDARELLWGISHFTEIEMKTIPTNYLRCYGGFMKITQTDYENLIEPTVISVKQGKQGNS